MKRLAAFAFTLIVVILLAGWSEGRKVHLDITMEGPWILHQAKVRNSDGRIVPVLIAIAPIDATADSLDGEVKYHHLPQISAGDGFYIHKEFLATAHIFCLYFDTHCAPKRVDAPTSDGYPDFKFLTMNLAPGTSWNWVNASQNQAAFILPMPDSWSADGIWHEAFGPSWNKATGDYPVPIGIHLHYKRGPSSVALMGCTFNDPNASTSSCTIPLVDNAGKPAPVLANTGTVRFEMKAPDTQDACDWHVREAWDVVYKILAPGFDKDHQAIDPAQSVDQTGKYLYDVKSCDPSSRPAPPATHGTQITLKSQSTLSSSSSETYHALTTTLITRLDGDLKQIIDIPGLDTKQQNNLKALREQLDTLNLYFPRISQTVLIADLSRSSHEFLDGLVDPAQALDDLRKARPLLETDDGTKNGGDCRAPLVLVQ
jgi:hypothetical protein